MKSKRRHKRKLSLLQQLKAWLKVLLALAIIGFIGWNVYYHNPSELLKIKAKINWEIDQIQLVSQQTLEGEISALVNEVYQLNLHDIKYELEQHPWVREAQVKRLFFDAISIKIITHKTNIHWQNITCKQPFKPKNCQGYITTQGILITPLNLFYHQDNEKSNQPVTLESDYNLEQSNVLLEDYKIYQEILGKFKIQTFVRSNIDSLSIAPNITIVLGYSKQQQRLKNFIKIYNKLKQKISRRKLNKASYDMRYPKSFTIKYRP